jgi:hypothetical protein
VARDQGAFAAHLLGVRLADLVEAVDLGVGELLARLGLAVRLDATRLRAPLGGLDARHFERLGLELALLDLALLERQHVLHRLFLALGGDHLLARRGLGADLAPDLLRLRGELGLLDLLLLEVERVLHLLAGEFLCEQALHAPAVVGGEVDLADLHVAQDDAVGREARLQLVLDRGLDLAALGREDLAHRVAREHLVDDALRRRLDDLGADVVGQALGEHPDLERIDRVANRQVGAEREPLDRLQRRRPVGAAHLRRAPALVAQRKDAHALQAGKDEDAALVPLADGAGDVVDADADLAAADALDGRVQHECHRRQHRDRADRERQRRSAQVEPALRADGDGLVAAFVRLDVAARRSLATPREARADRIEPGLHSLLPHDPSPRRGTIRRGEVTVAAERAAAMKESRRRGGSAMKTRRSCRRACRSSPWAVLAARGARRGDAVEQHFHLADLVGEEEDEARVEVGALGLRKAVVGGDPGLVETVGIGDVRLGLHAVAPSERARRSAASIASGAADASCAAT